MAYARNPPFLQETSTPIWDM